jgi:uracil-DNA glycosylase family 4
MAAKVKLPLFQDDALDAEPDRQVCEQKGPVCDGCSLAPRQRLVGSGPATADIVLVSESPTWNSANSKRHFSGKGGRAIRDAWDVLVAQDSRSPRPIGFAKLKRYDTYAIQCVAEPADFGKPELDRCGTYARAAIISKKPKVILTFGANALKALGVKSGKFEDVRGRLVTATLGGQTYLVLPTFGSRALLSSSGLYALLMRDVLRAMRLAAGIDQARAETSLETLTRDYVFPKTVEEVAKLCDDIIAYSVSAGRPPEHSLISVDTETNSLHPQYPGSKLLCVSFAWDTGKSCAIPLWHRENKLPVDEIVPHVRRVLASAKPKAFHNAKFDLKYLEFKYGWTVNNFRWCSLLGEHLLQEDQSGSYSLKVLGRSYFPEFSNYADNIHEIAASLSKEEESTAAAVLEWPRKSKKHDSTLWPEMSGMWLAKAEAAEVMLGTKKEQKRKAKAAVNYEKVPLNALLLYAAIDTDLTRRLVRNQYARMQEERFEQQGNAIMTNHCVPASRALGRIEYDGVRVDRPYLASLAVEFERIVAEKSEVMLRHWDPRWGEFNPNSGAHLSRLLYSEGVIGADGYRRTRFVPGIVEQNEKSKQWKVDKKTLRALVEFYEKRDDSCEFTKALLIYRAAHKAKSGFLEEIENLSARTGYLNTNYNLHGTSTGRLSSTAINQQNWPTFMAGLNMKKILIPDDPEEEVFVNLDYKGAEIRIFAAYARDTQLIKALDDGLDTHSFFASVVYGIPYEEMVAMQEDRHPNPKRSKELKALRTVIKRVVFGILYGAGPHKIAETASIGITEAQSVIDKLMTMFPTIKMYVEMTKGDIMRNGFVETFFGRRRRFPLARVNSFFRSQAERRGVNMKIQSTSSDIVIGQLVELYHHIGELGGRLALTVHDSIAAIVKKKYVEQLPDFLHHYCVERVRQKYSWLPVEFACDIEVGPSYGEVIPIGKYIAQRRAAEEARLKLSADQALERELDEEAMDELRDFENQQRDGAPAQVVEINAA